MLRTILLRLAFLGLLAGCAEASFAQQINLGPNTSDVRGILQPVNGGIGLNSSSSTGCPAVNAGSWTITPSNCTQASSVAGLVNADNVTISRSGGGVTGNPYIFSLESVPLGILEAANAVMGITPTNCSAAVPGSSNVGALVVGSVSTSGFLQCNSYWGSGGGSLVGTVGPYSIYLNASTGMGTFVSTTATVIINPGSGYALGVGGYKIGGVAYGTLATDAAAFGQIPTSLPTTHALTGAASGGASPGANFNGSAAVTFDCHTLGAACLNVSNTWTALQNLYAGSEVNGSLICTTATGCGGSATNITVGTTTISSGTSGQIEYNNAGVLGEKAVSGTGNVLLDTGAMATNFSVGTQFTAQAGSNAVISLSSAGITLGGSSPIYVVPLGNATSMGNYNSGTFEFSASYWNGTANAPDLWVMQNTLGTGTNPVSTLAFSHTGTPNSAQVSFPKVLTPTLNGVVLPTDGDLTVSTSGGGITTSNIAASNVLTLGGAVTAANFTPATGTGSCGATVAFVGGSDSNHRYQVTGTGTWVTPCIVGTFTYTNAKNHVSYPIVQVAGDSSSGAFGNCFYTDLQNGNDTSTQYQLIARFSCNFTSGSNAVVGVIAP